MMQINLFIRNNMTFPSAYIRKIGITLIFAVTAIFSAFAQNIEIKGKVLGEKNKDTVIGATIKLKNLPGGAVTDINGDFQLNVKSLPVTLNVRMIGYKNQDIEVNRNEPLTIYLTEDVTHLNDVVVVGYGSQKRKELTGSIASVSATHLEYNVAPSVDALLGGAVAGVNVTSSSGQPGSSASIRIRGGNSINASNDPLYVIDGFLFFSDNSSTSTGIKGFDGGSNPLNMLNPSDIESIEVLKDVSATAIYGSRGSNGIIMITTKKGKKEGISINYQYTSGWGNSVKKLDLLNATQWARLEKDYFLNKAGYTDAEIAQLGKGYDWQDAVLQTGISQNHAISLSGGDDKIHYFLSGNYLNQEGIIIHSGFKRFTGRFNLDKEVFPGFKIGVNLTGNKSTQDGLTTFEGVNYSSSPFSKGISNSLTYALYIPPVVPIYNSDGSYNYNNPFEYGDLRDGTRTVNPVSDLNNSVAQTINTAFFGNFFAQYSFKGLTAKVNLGNNVSYTTQHYFSPASSALGLVLNGIGEIGNKQVEINLSEFTLNYKKKSGIHSFDALAGFTHQENKTNLLTTTTYNFTNDELGVNGLQYGYPYGTTPIYSEFDEGWLNSFIGRLNYSLLERYNLTATFRSDESSKFIHVDHPWGFFPSVGVSWNVNEEGFLKDVSAISNLKLRASMGSVGNQEIPNNKDITTLGATSYGGQIGYTITNIADPNLRWETTTQYNIGVDAGFWNNKITTTVDAYYKNTSDLLLLIDPPLGQENNILTNAGNVVNKGIEASVNAVLVETKSIHWSFAANIAKNRNIITKLNGDNKEIFYGNNQILRVGEPLGSFYGLIFDGVVQKNEDVTKLPTTPAYTVPVPGDPKFVDVNKDNHIDQNDRVVLGSPQPNIIYGFSSSFKYKNFDLFVLVQGTQGNKVYNVLNSHLEVPNDEYNGSAALLNAWTPTNPSNTVPRITNVPLSSELDGRYIEDASYLRLKTITLGYTFKLFSNTNNDKHLNLRVFATAENVLTITGYKGYNPEIAKGIDLGSYPMARTFLAGASMSF
jgi:TonB-dependent starch-binding outer membrane protein SusC